MVHLCDPQFIAASVKDQCTNLILTTVIVVYRVDRARALSVQHTFLSTNRRHIAAGKSERQITVRKCLGTIAYMLLLYEDK